MENAHRNKPEIIWKNTRDGDKHSHWASSLNIDYKHLTKKSMSKRHINPHINIDLGNSINKTMFWPFDWLTYFGLENLLLGCLSQAPVVHICFLLFGPFRNQDFHWPGAGPSPAAGQRSLPIAELLLQAPRSLTVTVRQATSCLIEGQVRAKGSHNSLRTVSSLLTLTFYFIQHISILKNKLLNLIWFHFSLKEEKKSSSDEKLPIRSTAKAKAVQKEENKTQKYHVTAQAER